MKPLLATITSYGADFRAEFGHKHDDLRLLGQDNFRRDLPVRNYVCACCRRRRSSRLSPCVRSAHRGVPHHRQRADEL